MAVMKRLSRHKKIIIASGVGAAVAVLLMLATETGESEHKYLNHDLFAAADIANPPVG